MREERREREEESGLSSLLVWWTSQADVHGMYGEDGALPDAMNLPEYLYSQLRSRDGRNGRGRLWVDLQLGAEFGEIAIKPWPRTQIAKWAGESAGGIVFRAEHLSFLQGLPGLVTDLRMRRWPGPILPSPLFPLPSAEGNLMPIRRIHRPVVSVAAEIVALQCNVCGVEEPRQANGELPHDLHVVKLVGGWGDDFPGDLETITFVVHGRCLKAWCDTFRIPVEFRHVVGSIPPVHAVHSETGKAVILQWGGIRDAELPYTDPGIEETYALPHSDCIPSSGIYRHFKGGLYEVFDHGWDTEAPHEAYVVYRALYGESQVFARPARMWAETVEADNGGYVGPRFTIFQVGSSG